MPRTGRRVEHPSRAAGREVQHVEGVAVLLVGVGHRVRHVGVLLDLPLDGVRRDALAGVAASAVDDALTARVAAQPEHAVVHLGDGVRRDAADLVVGALDARQREVGCAGVVPYFGAVGAEHPDLAVIDDGADHTVRCALGAGKVERVDLGAVQQRRDPYALAVWLVEDEVAVEVADRHRAGEVRVHHLRKSRGALGIDVGFGVGDEDDLIAVVGDGHRRGARRDRADQGGRGGQRSEQVDLAARHHIETGGRSRSRPKPADRPSAHGLLEPQARRAVEECWHLAAFRHNLGKEVDHARVRDVDAAGNIAGAEDGRLHAISQFVPLLNTLTKLAPPPATMANRVVALASLT